LRLTIILQGGSVLLLVVLPLCLTSVGQDSRVSKPVVTAITQAIEDEIYDNQLNESYEDIGSAVDENVRRVAIYIEPNETQTGHYNVIYKMPPPYGELYRMVTLRNDGLAVLYSAPETGFPPTGPAFSTVYMDDDKVCSLKAGAVKAYLEILVVPTKDRLESAIRRQKARLGFSLLEHANGVTEGGPKHR